MSPTSHVQQGVKVAQAPHTPRIHQKTSALTSAAPWGHSWTLLRLVFPGADCPLIPVSHSRLPPIDHSAILQLHSSGLLVRRPFVLLISLIGYLASGRAGSTGGVVMKLWSRASTASRSTYKPEKIRLAPLPNQFALRAPNVLVFCTVNIFQMQLSLYTGLTAGPVRAHSH